MTLLRDSKPSISAILITLNEQKNIRNCLQSLLFCDEVIVVDGGSQDNTVQIAHSLGARIVTKVSWEGFGAQKSFALSLASSEWILSIDADEEVSPALQNEILMAISAGKSDGFYLSRRTQFLGRWLRWGGWSPDYVLRVARRSTCRFDDSPIHEKIILSGSAERLKSPLKHYSYPRISDVIQKQSRYSLASAAMKVRESPSNYSLTGAICRAAWKFFYLFVLRCGFLDGKTGLIAAISKSQETFWKYAAVSYLRD
jgi:glycosyltransferase involved in cell wall biosynthesis